MIHRAGCRRLAAVLAAAALSSTLASRALAQTSFVTFESGLVRPLALSPDGSTLFAVNAPDGRLEIFDVVSGGIAHSGSVAVGLEPVAVAARTNTEVWVVNHLSDSVSIVNVSGVPRVTRTLLVGDEPSDIVFAGPGGNRAFITTAHRGQNSPFPQAEHTAEGVGRADVWVFNALSLGSSLGGNPLTVVTVFGDKPRALAVSPDGGTVYAAIFHSGNQTTAINEGLVCNTSSTNINNNTVQGPCNVGGATMPGGSPPPHKNHQGQARPETGLILKFNRDGGSSNQWQDELGRNWNNAVKLSLPDLDVFAIDADAATPVEVDSFAHVGTILFNMVANPVTGVLYVANTEAQNHVRFEGPGTLAAGIKPSGEPATVRGHLAEARITVIDGGGNVLPRHLNKHIDYDAVPVPAGVKEKSLATPVGMAVSDDGGTLYVAAFGSAKIGVFDTVELESDTFTPDAADHITLSGGGPAGVVLAGDRLYTLTRFNNAVAVVDLTLGSVGTQIQSVPLHNPEPAAVVEGRPFLYDALLTSSNGEASCASCHIFGDMDDLAWDLGNPDDDVVANGNPFTVGSGAPFHPMKGPMTTQSLRGLVNMGPQHWRGDRQGNSTQAFNAFNVAFPGLVGRDEGQFTAAEMQKFTDFALRITYPPNPIRQLDNTLRSDEQAGRNLYVGRVTDTILNCNGCHTLNPANGFFGGNGNSSIEGETQEFKIPHLRNAYQKIGMFGMANTPGLSGSFAHLGNQVRGFGFLHDGSIDTVFRFTGAGVFSVNDTEQAQLEAFIMAFDSDLPPMVGQQITRTSTNAATVDPRINEMITAAAASYPSKLLGTGARQCNVVVRMVVGGAARSGLLLPSGLVQLDENAAAPVAESTVRAFSNTAGQEVTYTCVPFGSGTRMGLDRDGDGFFDFTEVQAGSDPADPSSTPALATATPTGVPTATASATFTPTPTGVPTGTATATFTPTPTGVPTGTASATATPTGTVLPTSTRTSTPTRTATPTPTPTPALCASGILIDRAKLKVSRNDAPAGDERIALKGQFALSNQSPPIDPVANGFRFEIVARQSGATLVSRFVPPGATPSSSIPGWTANGSLTRWKFKDRLGSSAGGIIKVIVKNKSAQTPGLFQFVAKGKDDDFRFLEEEVELIVVLGGPAQAAAGQCATREFNDSGGPDPSCKLSSSGRSMRCK